jgi:pseudaminic acid synthase
MAEFIIKTPKGKRKIGQGNPVFIVAEMSGNHNRNINRAYKIIDAAWAAGVDAIKIQTFTADTITIDSDKEYFKIITDNAWHGLTLYGLYKQAATPWEWQPKLKAYAESKGLVFFSSPFDETSVDFLEELKLELYKVSSYEIIDLPLLKRIGRAKKPVIISRGMAGRKELKEAIAVLKKSGAPQVAVLHCVSNYPALPKEMNLATIPDITKRYRVVAGLSDHSLGISSALVAVALGASIIEKHLTLKRADGGLDASFSIEPEEFKELVAAIREAELLIGKPNYNMGFKEEKGSLYRRSLFAVKEIKKGEKITKENIRSIRPGQGLKPRFYDQVIGRIAKKDIERGSPLSWSLLNK